MRKYRKSFIMFLLFLYFIVFIIELINYFRVANTLFGVIYLMIDLLIMFLFIPVVSNYNKYKSIPRISKIILILLIGCFNSFVLIYIVNSMLFYTDNTDLFIKYNWTINYVLKSIVYLLLLYFLFGEFKLDNRLNKIKDKINFLD